MESVIEKETGSATEGIETCSEIVTSSASAIAKQENVIPTEIGESNVNVTARGNESNASVSRPAETASAADRRLIEKTASVVSGNPAVRSVNRGAPNPIEVTVSSVTSGSGKESARGIARGETANMGEKSLEQERVGMAAGRRSQSAEEEVAIPGNEYNFDEKTENGV